MMNILRDADHVILGLPVLGCMAGGAACSLLEQTSYAPVRATGWLGTRAAIILGVVSGVPLLIYSLAKLTLAKALNAVSFNQYEYLRSFEKHTELQFTVTLVTVSTLPLIVFALPHMIRTAYAAYETYQEYQVMYDEFIESDLYITLKDLYTQIDQIIHPTAAIDLDAVENVGSPPVAVEE